MENNAIHFWTLNKALHTQNLGILRASTGTDNIEPMTSIAITFGLLTSKLLVFRNFRKTYRER